MRCYLRLSVAALLLLLGLGVIYGTLDHLALHDLRWPRPQTHDQHLTAAASLPRTAAPPVRGPRRAVRGEYATEIIWQLPSGSDAPVGLLLMAHGCSHGAYDFWPPTDDCPHCLGLPEEVALVSNGLVSCNPTRQCMHCDCGQWPAQLLSTACLLMIGSALHGGHYLIIGSEIEVLEWTRRTGGCRRTQLGC
eukprot:SAG31_NODE_1056_length_10132_cov_2.873816_4_plen_192_part_00